MCALRAGVEDPAAPTPWTEAEASAAAQPAAVTRDAVVIAAGAGRRLRETSADDELVKPITPVLGVPLVVRTLLTLQAEGAERAILVTGYQAEEVEALVACEPRLGALRIVFVRNPDWARQNGLSVLAARAALGGEAFLLSMADHLYSAQVVRRLRSAARAPGELLLAIDRRTGSVPDPEDAMWVCLGPHHRILDIGKDLRVYDAVDTGVFLADGSLFDALEAERHERGGDCALADGVRRLARGGQARAVDVGDAWWHDVDTRADLLRAERHLVSAAGSEIGRERAAS